MELTTTTPNTKGAGLMTTTAVSEVSVSLSEEMDKPSTAKSEVTRWSEDRSVFVSNDLSTYVHAESGDKVFIDIAFHSYASFLGVEERHSKILQVMNHTFTREEAKALAELILHELSK